MSWTVHPVAIDDARALAWRPDGRGFAVAGEGRVELVALDYVTPNRVERRFGDELQLTWVANRLVIGDGDSLFAIDSSGEVVARRDGGDGVLGPGGLLLRAGALEVLSDDLRPRRTIDAGGEAVDAAAGRAVVARGDRLLHIDLETGRVGGEDRLPAPARAVALAASGRRWLASGDAGVWLGGAGAPIEIAGRGEVIGFAGAHPVVGAQIFSPSGQPLRVLGAGGRALRADALAARPGGGLGLLVDGVVYVIDAATAAASEPAPGAVGHIDELAAGPGVLAARGPGGVIVWDLERRAIVSRWQPSDYSGGLAFAEDGHLLLGQLDGVEVWDWRAPRRVAVWRAPELFHVGALRCRRDRVLAVGHDRAVLFSRRGEALAVFGPYESGHGFAASLEDGDLHPTEPRLALARRDLDTLIAGDDGAAIATIAAAEALAFDDAGAHLLLGSTNEGWVHAWPPGGDPAPTSWGFANVVAIAGAAVWSDSDSAGLIDLGGGREEWASRFHDGAGALAASGEVFFTSGQSGWIGERSVADGSLAGVFPAGTGARIRAQARGDDALAAGDDSGRVQLWRLGEGGPERCGLADSSALPISDRFEVGALGCIEAVALGADGLVCAGGALFRWRAPLRRDIGDAEPDRRDIAAGCLSADGSTAAASDWSRPIEVFAVASGELVARLPTSGDARPNVSLSSGGERLLAVTERSLAVWSVAAGALVGRLDVDRDVRGAALTAAGDVAAWLSSDETERGAGGLWVRWDPGSGAVRRWLETPVDLGDVDGVCFGGDRALLWQSEAVFVVAGDRLERALPPPRRGNVWVAALSKDGGLAAVADDAGVIELWDLGGGRRIAELCTTADGSWWVAGDGDFRCERSGNLEGGEA